MCIRDRPSCVQQSPVLWKTLQGSADEWIGWLGLLCGPRCLKNRICQHNHWLGTFVGFCGVFADPQNFGVLPLLSERSNQKLKSSWIGFKQVAMRHFGA